ncbi:DUF2235 domain-containing protein [bacterium]|nr:MAG: DUF2235 domain-containing protein [bacterium]
MADEVVARPPRNIVLCFDGTGDWLAGAWTNVAKIYSSLERENQLTFYDGGIGTVDDDRSITALQRRALRLIDLGTATSLRQKVLNGYLFLVDHYQPGDKIFMFGFSRGAYTARLVAALLHNYGLLRKECRHLAPYLWDAINKVPERKDWLGRQNREYVDWIKSRHNIRRQFGWAKDLEPRIHFMGLFDTVSSIGVISRFRVFPNTDYNPHVRRICHAVAMDEERNAFPEHLVSERQKNATEVWFPGVHRDVGGGHLENETIARSALGWIANEAEGEGLRLNHSYPPYDPTAETAVRGNFAGFDPYAFLGLYPMQIFVRDMRGFRFFWPNFRHVRPIPEHALVHEVAKAMPLDRFTKQPPKHWPKAPAWFPEHEAPPSNASSDLKSDRVSLGDLAGMTLLMPFVLMLYYSAMGSFFGSTWPPGTKPFVALVVLGVVASQGLSRSSIEWMPPWLRPRNSPLIVLGGGLVLAYAAIRFAFLTWPLAYIGAVFGAILWAWAQLSPPALLWPEHVRPPLRMSQALGFVVQRLIGWSKLPIVISLAIYLASLGWKEVRGVDPVVWGLLTLWGVAAGLINAWNDVLEERERLRRLVRALPTT